MTKAPVLQDSDAFEDFSTNGRRTSQANKGIAAFSADVFAEDQVFIMSGSVTANVGDIITQGSNTGYIDKIINSTTLKVRTSDTFVTGSGTCSITPITVFNLPVGANAVQQTSSIKGTPVDSTRTITTIEKTGFVNVKDRGITFDKIQDIPENSVIGRGDIGDPAYNADGVPYAVSFDQIIDLGPGAGVHGGEIVAQGSPQEIMNTPNSSTAEYLGGKRMIEIPAERRKPHPVWPNSDSLPDIARMP